MKVKKIAFKNSKLAFVFGIWQRIKLLYLKEMQINVRHGEKIGLFLKNKNKNEIITKPGLHFFKLSIQTLFSF